MLNSKRRILNNAIVCCLSVFIVLLSLLPAFAESPVQLTVDNVVEYPTAEGEMYYTQKVGDYITLSGGKVTADGTAEGEEVVGHFEFIDPDFKPNMGPKSYAGIKFVPDSDEYIGFEIEKPTSPRFVVNRSPMEFVDSNAEIKSSDIATPGDYLRTSSLTPVDLKCSLTNDPIANAKWNWSVPSTKVYESGYYLAKITATGFLNLEVYVYVKIAGDDSEAPIKEFPTVEPITYHEGLKAGELKLVGGKGAVEGKFEVSDPEQELIAGNNTINVVFKPDDGSQSINISIVVDVAKAESTFIDEEGKPTIPELHYLVGTNVNSKMLQDRINSYRANCGSFVVTFISCPLFNYDTSKAGTYDAIAMVKIYNTNYTTNIKFKIVIDAQTVTPKISIYGNDEFAVTFDSYTVRPNGTFTVTVDGKDIGVSGVKYNERFTWRPEHSGTYTIKVVYNPIENDTYNINEIEQTLENILTWKINTVNCIAQPCEYGATASVSTTLGDKLGGWKFYDENGKEIQIEYDDTQYSTITFTMPDHEITVKAIDKTQANIPGSNDDSDFFSSFLAWLRNLLARFRALMDAVAQLLQVVG